MHELGGDVAGLLRDLVDFLEGLAELELPAEQRSARAALLGRSRAALEAEPYLDMSAGGRRPGPDETDRPQEYVAADARPAQHYYETFQELRPEPQLDDVLLLYAGFSAAQAKHKALKSGALLQLKGERRMFAPFNVFWLNRQQCWVGLVGSHLLLYGGERDSRPFQVLPLRGYKGRPAPGALARDSRRGEAAFELYCPGERTFQFAAKSAAEMREWLGAVAESLGPEAERKPRAATFGEILELDANERICLERVREEREKYQDVLGRAGPAREAAPPLPARTRRLPSLPSQDQLAGYEAREELYDEDGLYHRIEDVRAQREERYENCPPPPAETYDDVQARDGPRASAKRSFLDRVRSRRDSAKKPARPELPCYDEVSSTPDREPDREPEPEPEPEEEEYLSPPPPRPIYSRPPTMIKCVGPADDIYDDIGSGGCASLDVIKDYPKNGSFLSDLQLSIDREHYQVPKSGSRRIAEQPEQPEQPEELYDDVTLSEAFRSRPRDSAALVAEKSVWSRFGSGKRPGIFDRHLGRQSSCSEANEATDGSGEQHQQQTKVKSLQKLISKMENSLGKASKANGVA